MKPIIIITHSEEERKELSEILHNLGYTWNGGDDIRNDTMRHCKEELCYYLEEKRVSWADLKYVKETNGKFITLSAYKKMIGIKDGQEEINILTRKLINSVRSLTCKE